MSFTKRSASPGRLPIVTPSNFVRLHRALADAGQHAILDLYEGISHAFQAYPAQMASRESRTALDATAAFLVDHPDRRAG